MAYSGSTMAQQFLLAPLRIQGGLFQVYWHQHPQAPIAQQELHIANHITDSSLRSTTDYLAGSLIRAQDFGFLGLLDSDYTNRKYAIPQVITDIREA